MFICICNGFNDAQVREALRAGAGTPEDVYQALNCQPQCGVCIEAIEQLVSTHQAANDIDTNKDSPGRLTKR